MLMEPSTDHPSASPTTAPPLVISPSDLNFPRMLLFFVWCNLFVPRVICASAPFTRVITNILKFHNTSTKPVAYKVKTTAPKRYVVRPNVGLIAPRDTVEIQGTPKSATRTILIIVMPFTPKPLGFCPDALTVLLNPLKDPPSSLKCKDKFLVQSILDDGHFSADIKDLVSNFFC